LDEVRLAGMRTGGACGTKPACANFASSTATARSGTATRAAATAWAIPPTAGLEKVTREEAVSQMAALEEGGASAWSAATSARFHFRTAAAPSRHISTQLAATAAPCAPMPVRNRRWRSSSV